MKIAAASVSKTAAPQFNPPVTSPHGDGAIAHPLLYELNTRCWLRALAGQIRQPVTLDRVPETEFSQWRDWGLTHIWLMGVWSGGPRARARALADPRQRAAYAEALPDWSENDTVASPYAVAEYAVPAALGGNQGLALFRQRLHEYGLRLVLDFVPNHLGVDHPWVRSRPELFVQAVEPDAPEASDGAGQPATFREQTGLGPRRLAHGRDPYFPAWTDTVQLDYRRAETRLVMAELLQNVAGRCDGLRCDMAMLLLNDVFARTWSGFPPSAAKTAAGTEEFWATAIAPVKQSNPDFLFLAEAYWGTGARLQALGFDYTYDKALYDHLVARDGAGAQHYLSGLSPAALAAGAHFLENHDEPRVAALLSLAEHRAAALVVLGLPGLRLLHEGQLEGARRRLPVQLGRRPAEPVDREIRNMYDQLLAALRESAVGHGKFELLRPKPAWPENPTAQNFVLVRWTEHGPGFDLVVVNLAPHRSQCYAPLAALAGANQWMLEDRLGPERYLRNSQELEQKGLYLDLPAHGTQNFKFTPA